MVHNVNKHVFNQSTSYRLSKGSGHLRCAVTPGYGAITRGEQQVGIPYSCNKCVLVVVITFISYVYDHTVTILNKL